MEKFVIKPAPGWAQSPSENQIVNSIKSTPLRENQFLNNKDHCYFLKKIFLTKNDQNNEYTSMLYSVNQTDSLDFTSIYEVVISKNEVFELNRIFVVREGKIVDKINDIDVKVFDNENSSKDWIIDNSKKINIKVFDIRIWDVFYIEHNIVENLPQEDFLRKKYIKYILQQPSSYWTYDIFESIFINERQHDVVYKKYFFRDKKWKVLEDKINILKTWEKYVLTLKDFDSENKEKNILNPYIYFATKDSEKNIWDELNKYYKIALEENIDDLTKEIFSSVENINSLDWKIRYIIEYVQNNIKYIYSNDYMHGHKPQLPSETFSKKQWDCKAKVVLLVAMLRKLWVDASPILVNYSSDFYLSHYLPSGLNYNHVIVKIEKDWKTYFVDPTKTGLYWKLQNRSKLMFINYFDIQKWKIMKNLPIKEEVFSLESNIKITALKDIWHIVIEDIYRDSRSDSVRNNLKTKSKNEILTLWQNMIFNNMNYAKDRNTLANEQIFSNPKLEIIYDDKDKNEIKIRFESDIINPYLKIEWKNYLMYFERAFIKSDYINYLHEDVEMYLTSDAIKMDIELITQDRIFTNIKYTKQQIHIKNKYFEFETKKTITKNSWKVHIEYKPISNIEVEKNDEQSLKQDFEKISDSNHWICIDIKQAWIVGKFKRIFDKRTYWRL